MSAPDNDHESSDDRPQSVVYVEPGKLICIVTGELRDDTPEEQVRQQVSRSLMEEYDYSRDQLELEFPVQMGRARKKVDIAVFPEDVVHRQEHIDVVVETKRDSVRAGNKNNGVDQLKSYMAASLNCRFGLWTNGLERVCFERTSLPDSRYSFEQIIDIPSKGRSLEEIGRPEFTHLLPATELRLVFKRCHNYIFGNQGLSKDVAFHELLKVIFCKVHDERISPAVKFYVTNREARGLTGHLKVKERLEGLFSEVKDSYAHIFDVSDRLELEPRVLSFIVGQLQKFSLLDTNTDVKGEAYEEIVGANLRGDRGEFFTPRNVCVMAVGMALASFEANGWHSLKILDPACGTGGFLIAVINHLRQHFIQTSIEKWGDSSKALVQAEKRLKEACARGIYGIDFNPSLVRASQMNEVMHGNGSANLFAVNSLLPPGTWPDHVRRKIKLGWFDIVLTNPPFGSQIPVDDPHVLEQYGLGHVWDDKSGEFERTNRLRSRAPPEELFLERCLQFLKPGGVLAMVLPDRILSNPGLLFIRSWLLRHTRILASIDLPVETFEPFVGEQTSVLVVQNSPPPQDYEVFMSAPGRIGHDKRGSPVYLRSPDGERILSESIEEVVRVVDGRIQRDLVRVIEPVLDDHLPGITNEYKRWRGNRVEESDGE